MKEEKIHVLKIEVGKEPKELEIDNTLEAFQREVQGLIQPVYLDNDVLAIVNEEGKLKGMQPNRWLGQNDIICGPMILCGDSGEDFGSLSEEQMEYCQQQFGAVPEFTGQEAELNPIAYVIGFDPYEG